MARQKHTVEVIKPQLQIDEHLDLHEKGWKIQRAGWVLIFLIPVMGLLGLFGEGVLSQQKPKAGNFTVTYDRFYRYEKEMMIEVESASDHISTISLPQAYLRNFRIVRIIPEPENNQSVDNNVVYNFLGNENKIVTIYMIPEDYGSIKGTLKVNNQTFSLNHFIYP